MKCKDCAHFERAYVHSVTGEHDFGMRNYGPGMCRRHNKAVWDTHRACTQRSGCSNCARHKRVYTKEENGVYTDTGHIVCMIRKTDVSRRKLGCIYYLPEKGDNGCNSTDDRNPKLGRFIPDVYFIRNVIRRSAGRFVHRLRRFFGL